MLVRPITMKPARRSRATTGASASAGAESSSAREPARVTCPLMSKRSFTETGMPANGDGAAFALRKRIHRIGGFKRGLLVDMNEGALALAGGIGNPGETLLDQLSGAGAAIGEIVGERSKRLVRHGCPVSWLVPPRKGGAP